MSSLTEHIDQLPPAVKKIYKILRTVARKNMPGAYEMVYHNALGYSTSASPWDRVCYIAHQPKGYINFGFFFGNDLPDPTGIIEGEGKRLRHVKVFSVEEAKNEALQHLVEAAWKKAHNDVAKWRQSLKRKNK
jgi:hypothetical protein